MPDRSDVVVIAGASRIGGAVVQRFAGHGIKLALVALSRERWKAPAGRSRSSAARSRSPSRAARAGCRLAAGAVTAAAAVTAARVNFNGNGRA